MAHIIPVETSYKIWFPKDIYSNAVPVIIFMKENCMDYDNLRNCYIIKPSTQTGGKAIINFTAVNGDVFTASLSADSYRILAANPDKIGVSDYSIMMKGSEMKEYRLLNLYIKETI